MDLSRLGGGERDLDEARGREGRVSGSERAKPSAAGLENPSAFDKLYIEFSSPNDYHDCAGL